MCKAIRIVGDEQAHRDMCSLETLGKFHSCIAAYGMADSGDRLGVATVVADRLIGDTAPHKVGTDVCRYAGAVDALSQLVHAPIDKVDHAAEQIGAPMRLGRPSLGGGTGEARCDQDGCDGSGSDHFDKAGYEAGDNRPIPVRSTSATACCRANPPDHGSSRIFQT